MASMKKEIEQEHSMRVRAEQEVQTLQSENEALHKEIEALKEKLAAAQATPLSPTQPPQPSPFSKGFQAAEAHKDGAQRPMFQMGRTRILKQQRQSSPPQQPPSQQQQQQVSPSSSPSLPQQ